MAIKSSDQLTVVDLTEEEPKILREGGIPAEELLAFLREG